VSDDRAPAIERGIALGYGYAERHKDDRLSLKGIARARSAADVTANLDVAEAAPGGIADPVAFWSGFAHGVARYLLEEGHALLDQPA
jgi:hypothetical protein